MKKNAESSHYSHIDLRKRGDKLLKEHEYKSAIAHYESALKVDGRYYTAYVHLGNAYVSWAEFQSQEIDQEAITRYITARAYYFKAIDAKKNYVYAYRVLGDLYQKLGDIYVPNKKAYYSDFLKDDTENTKDNVDLPKICCYKKSVEHYEHALSYKWDYIIDRIKLGDVFSKLGSCIERVDEKKQYYNKANDEYSTVMEISIKYKDIANKKSQNISKLITDLSEQSTNVPDSTEINSSDDEFEETIDLKELIPLHTAIIKGENKKVIAMIDDIIKTTEISHNDQISIVSDLLYQALSYEDDFGSSAISYILRFNNTELLEYISALFTKTYVLDTNFKKNIADHEIKKVMLVTSIENDNLKQFLDLFYQEKIVNELIGANYEQE